MYQRSICVAEVSATRMEPTSQTLLVCLLLITAIFPYAWSTDSLDPNGNITIRWDIMLWTVDGYVANINITNYQSYRPVNGWKLHWSWPQKEVIWNIFGAHVSGQGKCSMFNDDRPTSCSRTPIVTDLAPNSTLSNEIEGCCKGGVLLTKYQNLKMSTVGFQVTVGRSGNTNDMVRLPKNFTFEVPGGGYSCGPARIIRPIRFISPDFRRVTKAYKTWEAVCTYTRPRGYKPTCCVSLSSYRGKKIPCPTCACSCPIQSKSCSRSSNADRHANPTIQCTGHMCPIRIDWHLQPNDKGWDRRYLVSISNLNLLSNYSDWILAVEHSGGRLINVSNAHQSLLPSVHNNTEIVWGIRKNNQLIAPYGKKGSVAEFTLIYRGLSRHHNFPTATYFNGNLCRGPQQP